MDFNYSNLLDIEKEIILLLGNDVEVSTQTVNIKEGNLNTKDADDVYEVLIKNSYITKEKYFTIIKNLFIKGMVEFGTEKSRLYVNYEDDLRHILDNKVKDIINKNQEDSYLNRVNIRLTNKEERIVSGRKVYDQILQKKSEEIYNNVLEVKDKTDNFYQKIIEIIAIFIAIFSLIVGNILTFTILKDKNLMNIISLVVIINGSLLFSISSLIFLINNYILTKKLEKKSIILFLLPIILLTSGIILYLNI